MPTYYTTLISIIIFFSSCSVVESETSFSVENTTMVTDTLMTNVDIINDQDRSLDALDEIQISGDHLYSTFPNNSHKCYEVIGSFNISQEEMENAILELLSLNYLHLTYKKRVELADAVAQGQKAFHFKICNNTSIEEVVILDSLSPPRLGTWIFTAMQDQRDLIINW